MTIPAEYAWLVPVIIPLLIGLLLGVIIKKTVKLVFAVIALLILLVATGYISLTFQTLYDSAMQILPNLLSTGQGAIDVLPYSSITFLIGLALGLWRG